MGIFFSTDLVFCHKNKSTTNLNNDQQCCNLEWFESIFVLNSSLNFLLQLGLCNSNFFFSGENSCSCLVFSGSQTYFFILLNSLYFFSCNESYFFFNKQLSPFSVWSQFRNLSFAFPLDFRLIDEGRDS